MNQPSDRPSGPPRGKEPPLTREQGHAFKNIFSIILANAELIGEETAATGSLQRRLERIVQASRRGEELVHRLRQADPEATAVRLPEKGGHPQPVRGSGQILVVDDEEDVVEIISRFLGKAELTVQGVTDPRKALELFRANPAAYDLVITDLDMPHLSGAELCQDIHALRPEMPILLVTGYDRQAAEYPGSGLGIRELLAKPLSREQLLSAVRRILIA